MCMINTDWRLFQPDLPSSSEPFLPLIRSMQIAVLIFAPAFLAAGWYIMLGQLIGLLGRSSYC
jgi:hypothetical protein